MMTKAEAKAEYGALPDQDSIDVMRDIVLNQLKWQEYVPESEFTSRDRQKLLSAFKRFYLDIRPITAKYIDGE